MNDAQLIERLAKTDPVAAAIPLPDGWSADAHLRELEQRMRIQPEATTRPTGTARSSRRLLPVAPPPTGRGRLAFAAAGIAVAIAVVAAAALVGQTGVLSPAAPATIDGETALATADDVFAAVNAGDPDGVIAEFVLPDPTIEHRQPLTIPDWGTFSPYVPADTSWYESLVWHAAAGTTTTPPDCAVTDAGDGTAVTVVCQYAFHFVPEESIGVPPVPVRSTMVITPSGVSEWIDEGVNGQGIEWVSMISAFRSWVFAHHPGALDILDASSSVDEFRDHGRLVARYADEWAEFLEARDCSYPTECFFETPATGGD